MIFGETDGSPSAGGWPPGTDEPGQAGDRPTFTIVRIDYVDHQVGDVLPFTIHFNSREEAVAEARKSYVDDFEAPEYLSEEPAWSQGNPDRFTMTDFDDSDRTEFEVTETKPFAG